MGPAILSSIERLFFLEVNAIGKVSRKVPFSDGPLTVANCYEHERQGDHINLSTLLLATWVVKQFFSEITAFVFYAFQFLY